MFFVIGHCHRRHSTAGTRWRQLGQCSVTYKWFQWNGLSRFCLCRFLFDWFADIDKYICKHLGRRPFRVCSRTDQSDGRARHFWQKVFLFKLKHTVLKFKRKNYLQTALKLRTSLVRVNHAADRFEHFDIIISIPFRLTIDSSDELAINVDLTRADLSWTYINVFDYE